MQPIRFLFFFFFLLLCLASEGQKNSNGKPMAAVNKFICLKPIEKNAQWTMNNRDFNSENQLKRQIIKLNPLCDTMRDEFHLLIHCLLKEITKSNLPVTGGDYNLFMNNYNNICQILDFLWSQNLPKSFLILSKNFYLQQIDNPAKEYSYSKVIRIFRKQYPHYRLIKTGNKPINGDELIVQTPHNQLEKIIAQINPCFASFSIKKQLKYQRQVQVINPWIGSFKKGLTYNTTRETFFAEDELVLLVPYQP